MIENYENLISEKRRRETQAGESRDINQESESDRARFIFSSPLRRLQQKAQVYSLEDNAAVRSRLTHSLEVAQTGRYIAQLILKELATRNQLDLYKLNDRQSAFINFVETACLMHDVGNPPFGHLGEFAIQEWFKDKAKECIAAAGIDAQQNKQFIDKFLQDFTAFDGNCQGLRIVTRLQWNNDEYGLNLTYSQLASYLKYVVHNSQKNEKSSLTKKGGYFLTEDPIVKQAWSLLGMTEHSRHPLAYIMEAADDIAYSISDIEDAIQKNLIRLKDVLDDLENRVPEIRNELTIKTLINKTKEHLTNNHLSPFTDFRTGLTRWLANYACSKYLELHSDMLNGTAEGIFEHEDIHSKLLTAIKNYAINNIYKTPAASNNELAGFSVLNGILEHYRPLLACHYETFHHACDSEKKPNNHPKANRLQKKLADFLPKRYLKVYNSEIEKLKSDDFLLNEWFHRAHLITDYLSGMTDDFALETYQLLAGIRVGKPV